jgi:hypothetical protein
MEKRKYHYDVSGDAESAEDGPSKRACQHGDGHVVKNIKFGRVDPTFGQRSAIPGLDDYDGEYPIDGDGEDTELDYENSIDALSYLRAVRYVLLCSLMRSLPFLLEFPPLMQRSRLILCG